MKRLIYLFLLQIVIYCHLVTCDDTSPLPVVEIPLGRIEGTRGKSISGKEIYKFEGVPYATPPVGKYRFEKSLPAKPWNGTWQAKTNYKCLQYDQYANPGDEVVIGDEDCLYINIYTPKLDPKANLDVVVYIHGGGFMFSHGGALGPEMILDNNIVYAKFNYRLGPLGFLSTEDDLVPGNNGLKDQTLALKWIQENIKYFGGNPNSVTITGMSAGGASVHFHYLMEESKGLFHKGISQSGTVLNPWVLMENALDKTKKIAATVGCPSTDDTKEIIKCLKKKPGRQIVYAVKQLQPWLHNPFSPFAAVVDTWASKPSLPDHPYNLLKTKRVHNVPWIASFTNSEGLFPASDFYDYQLLKDIDTRWNELMPLILHYNYTIFGSLKDTVSRKIRQFYFKDKPVSKSTYMELIEMMGDRLFVVDIEKAVRLHSAAIKSSCYLYNFAYRGAHSGSEIRTHSTEDFGASHGDDTCYIYRTALDVLSTENDRLMSQLLIKMFTSFMKTGRPYMPVDWTPLSKNPKDPINLLKISSPQLLEMETYPVLGNRQFWDSLPFKENEQLFGIKDEL